MSRRRAAAAALLLALAGCTGGDDDGAAEQASPTAAATARAAAVTSVDVPALYDRVAPSVVTVLVRGAQGQGGGSGVIWRPEGAIVTNNHVVEGADRIQVVLATGERLDARVRAADPLTDLALVSVERGGLPAAEFAGTLPDIGELALAMGNPLGFENSVTAGIVSGLDRAIPSGGRTPALVNLIQTDAAISPGNSGGALVNGRGEVIGINVAYIPPQGGAVSLGFAIPSTTVVDVLEQLEEDGTVDYAFVGVQVVPLTESIASELGLETTAGVAILDVGQGSPASGVLRPGDVLVEFAGEEIRSVEDFYGAVREQEPGDRVGARVIREGDERDVQLTLGTRPAG